MLCFPANFLFKMDYSCILKDCWGEGVGECVFFGEGGMGELIEVGGGGGVWGDQMENISKF